MDIITKIVGVLLFALATIIIYSWGLIRQRNQSRDLFNLLFSKANSKVNKYLKKNEYITIADVEEICAGMSAKQPFSKNRAVVKDKKDFAGKLVEYMVKTDQLTKEGNRYKKNK